MPVVEDGPYGEVSGELCPSDLPGEVSDALEEAPGQADELRDGVEVGLLGEGHQVGVELYDPAGRQDVGGLGVSMYAVAGFCCEYVGVGQKIGV